MSKADVLFVNMCRDILDNGFSTEGQTVRARWEDGTPAHTIKQFGVVNRYNLQEEFPALTLRNYEYNDTKTEKGRETENEKKYRTCRLGVCIDSDLHGAC